MFFFAFSGASAPGNIIMNVLMDLFSSAKVHYILVYTLKNMNNINISSEIMSDPEPKRVSGYTTENITQLHFTFYMEIQIKIINIIYQTSRDFETVITYRNCTRRYYNSV